MESQARGGFTAEIGHTLVRRCAAAPRWLQGFRTVVRKNLLFQWFGQIRIGELILFR